MGRSQERLEELNHPGVRLPCEYSRLTQRDAPACVFGRKYGVGQGYQLAYASRNVAVLLTVAWKACHPYDGKRQEGQSATVLATCESSLLDRLNHEVPVHQENGSKRGEVPSKTLGKSVAENDWSPSSHNMESYPFSCEQASLNLIHIAYPGYTCGTRRRRDAYLKRRLMPRSVLVTVSSRTCPPSPATRRRYTGTRFATFLLMPVSITCMCTVQ